MEHLVLPETQGEGNMNQLMAKTYWDVQAQEDVAKIAKRIRRGISLIPGCTFSVKINRQWAKSKDKPHSVIYVNGMVKFWGDDYTPEKQRKAELLLHGILKDVAEAHQLELTEGMKYMSYMLIQHH